MYIIELISKLKNRKNKKLEFEENIPQEPSVELEDIYSCEHIFMPIDSTKTILACSKCGYVVKNSKIKFDEIDKNPFNFI